MSFKTGEAIELPTFVTGKGFQAARLGTEVPLHPPQTISSHSNGCTRISLCQLSKLRYDLWSQLGNSQEILYFPRNQCTRSFSLPPAKAHTWAEVTETLTRMTEVGSEVRVMPHSLTMFGWHTLLQGKGSRLNHYAPCACIVIGCMICEGTVDTKLLNLYGALWLPRP